MKYVNIASRRPLIFDMRIFAIFWGGEEKKRKVPILVGIKTVFFITEKSCQNAGEAHCSEECVPAKYHVAILISMLQRLVYIWDTYYKVIMNTYLHPPTRS